jgi:hypothetical protein
MGPAALLTVLCATAVSLLLAHLAYLRPPFAYSGAALSAPAEAALLHRAREPLAVLTQQQRREFNATGLLLLRGVVPRAVAVELRKVIEAEPPLASPLFGENIDHVVSHAWAFYTAFGQVTAAGLTASVAAQLFGAPERQTATHVRLVNAVVYGVGRGQHGADWHTDEISYRPLGYSGANRSARGISAWMPLQPVGDNDEGGGLLLVPSNTASRDCFAMGVHDPVSGRVRPTAAASECSRTLQQRGLSTGPMQPGDVLFFERSVWHRSDPPTDSFVTPHRFSYTERFAPDDALFRPKDVLDQWSEDILGAE